MSNISHWKQVSSKTILNHDLMKINEDVVELPNSKQAAYVLRAPTDTHSVIIIAVNYKNEILIQREYSYPPDEVMWQLPGGAMEPGEEVIEAARRELAEESGYGANQAETIGYFYVSNRKSNRKQHIVLCTDLFEHKIPEDDDEFIESSWLSIDLIHEKTKAGEFVNINLLSALNVWLHGENDQ